MSILTSFKLELNMNNTKSPHRNDVEITFYGGCLYLKKQTKRRYFSVPSYGGKTGKCLLRIHTARRPHCGNPSRTITLKNSRNRLFFITLRAPRGSNPFWFCKNIQINNEASEDCKSLEAHSFLFNYRNNLCDEFAFIFMLWRSFKINITEYTCQCQIIFFCIGKKFLSCFGNFLISTMVEK